MKKINMLILLRSVANHNNFIKKMYMFFSYLEVVYGFCIAR